MNAPFLVRRACPEDGNAAATLFNSNPDTGRIAIAAYYHHNPLQLTASLNANNIAAVAYHTDLADVIGVGLARLHEAMNFNGRLQQAATLNSLIVHPAHRGQGVAKALAQWRINEIRTTLGKDALILAIVQQGNEASLAVTKNWRQALLEPLESCLTPTLKKPQQQTSGLSIRWAEDGDWEEIASKFNQFYRDYLFFAPETAISLNKWVKNSPLDQPVRRYLVAVDSANNLVAGLGVTEQYQFMQMKVTRLPRALQILNYLVKMVPADGYLKQSAANYFWFAPGHTDAARTLWQEMRWRISANSSHLTFSYDPRGPFPSIIRLPRWMPKGRLLIASSQLPLEQGQLLYPP